MAPQIALFGYLATFCFYGVYSIFKAYMCGIVIAPCSVMSILLTLLLGDLIGIVRTGSFSSVNCFINSRGNNWEKSTRYV